MEKLYINKEDCCGCSACLSICPKHAIYMKHDEKGYLYPEIRKDSCVNCGLCEKVCPLKDKEKNKKFEKIAYGVKNKDEHERAKSSSGGVFVEVAKYILNNDGVVYGVEMNNDFQVKHGRATTIEDARKFQGSKYVQSDKHSIFCMVQKDLKEGKEVLFTGTPCEVAGLKKYLRKEYDNLYTLDLICHGVPSSELLNAFLKGKEKYYNIMVNFSVINVIAILLATRYWIYARFNMYFSLYMILLLIWCIKYLFDERNEKIIYLMCMGFYALYYYYEMHISLGYGAGYHHFIKAIGIGL